MANTRRAYHHGDLRSALLEVARSLVLSKGPRAFSLTEAARQVGVTHAAPYRHFTSADAMLAALAQDALGELLPSLRAAAQAPDPAPALARALLDFAEARPQDHDTFNLAGLQHTDHPGLKAAGAACFGVMVEALGDAGRAAALWSLAHGAATLARRGALDGLVPDDARLAAIEDAARHIGAARSPSTP
ncbi:TetR/AcrR family transcriptional regulator [Myxococcota bacterium]|nr:TetR/AcrR family transcriptional regulator [Myxococcota bacterium]